VTPQEWERVKELLEDALEHEGEERAALLETARESEPAAVQEVERLLEVDDDLGDFIEEPAFDIHDRDDPAVRVGQTLGPWRLVRELGSGGMGAVYLAVRDDDEFEQTVAVKVLKRGLDTEEVIHRFRTERQILAGLDHPNIARLYDGGTTPDGRPYLVMERVEGRPVDVYCHDEGLDVDERLDLFLTVCDAVQFAHRNLVVHRDLKPTNILVNDEGVPKLLDFGIARLLSPERGDALPTVGAWRFLTPEYASPEQLTGQPVTTASDVYSLGVLLHLLLTDHRPFDPEERSAAGMLRALDAGEPPRPSTDAPVGRRKRLRGDLDNIVLTALRREPERRYGSADQLADDVRRFLAGLPVRATPDSWTYRAQKFVRRHRVAVTAATAIAVLLVGFSVVAWVLTENEMEARQQSDRIIKMFETAISKANPDNASGTEVTMWEAVNEAWREVAGEREDPLLRARVLKAVGITYLSRGQAEEAGELFREALRLRMQVLDGDDPLIAEILSHVADSLRQRGLKESAALVLKQAITIERLSHSSEDPEVLSLENNLALLWSELEHYEEAERLQRQILQVRRRTDGEPPLEIAYTLHNLATALLNQNKFEEAETYYAEALDLRQENGEKATPTAKTMNGLATCYQSLGRFGAARDLFHRAELLLRSHSVDHPQLFATLNNLALLDFDLGRFNEAENEIREALKIRDHPTLRRNLAAVLLELGDLDEADKQIATARSMLRQGWRVKDFESVAGAILAARRRFTDAEPLLLGSYTSLVVDQGLEKRNTLEALNRLIKLYDAWGKPNQAAHWRAVRDGKISPLPPEFPQPDQPGT